MLWTSKTLLNWSIDQLKKAHIENPQLDGELLLAKSLNCDRVRILTEPDRIINQDEFLRCQDVLDRRVNREPIHYILNYCEFWSHSFWVSPGVLIPRPETEFLVQVLLKLNTKLSDASSPVILDIGTGSGNLAVTGALEIPTCRVTAVDVSQITMETAQYNAGKQGVEGRIQFQLGDIFTDSFCETLDAYDYILCNPPYIPSAQVPELMPEVKDFEPHEALDGGPDGLEFYRYLIPKSKDLLNPGGHLILEFGDGQWPAISKMLSRYFETPGLVHDYADQPRVAFAQKRSYGHN